MRWQTWQRNLGALWLGQALTMIAFNLVFPFFPLYVQELGVSDPTQAVQWASYIAAAGAVVMSVAQIVWGTVADRIGRKRTIVMTMAGASIAVASMGVVTTPLQLLFARMGHGAMAGANAAANALVSALTPKNRMGFALGTLQVAFFMGIALGPLIGGFLADALGYRNPFFIAGLMVVVGVIAVAAIVREDFKKAPPTQAKVGIWQTNRSLSIIPLFLMLNAVVFLTQLGSTIVFPVLSMYVAELGGRESAATAAGIVMGAGGVVGAVAAVSLGRLGDKIGHKTILAVCLIGAAVAYVPQAFAQEVWHIFALRCLLGIFQGGLMPSANALVVSLVPPEKRGAAFGMVATSTSLSLAVGPLAAAGLVGAWGLRSVFIATGIVFSVAFVGFLIDAKRNRAYLESRQIMS